MFMTPVFLQAADAAREYYCQSCFVNSTQQVVLGFKLLPQHSPGSLSGKLPQASLWKKNTLLEQETILRRAQAPGLLTLKQVVRQSPATAAFRLKTQAKHIKDKTLCSSNLQRYLSWPEFVSEASLRPA
ncbi:hypothetical protein WJX77_012282 [Trebouxia sp. C0004]